MYCHLWLGYTSLLKDIACWNTPETCKLAYTYKANQLHCLHLIHPVCMHSAVLVYCKKMCIFFISVSDTLATKYYISAQMHDQCSFVIYEPGSYYNVLPCTLYSCFMHVTYMYLVHVYHLRLRSDRKIHVDIKQTTRGWKSIS